MRKEPFGVGSFVHVIKRGARGLPIVRDDDDCRRFLLMLAHFNDEFASLNWYRDLMDADIQGSFERPAHWPERKAIVNIIGFCLLTNHFHLMLEEITEGGIARFMQRIGVGMAKRFNEKYKERGSLFQGSYRSKTIDNENYLKYVSVYVQVKNAFDMHPRGYRYASREFDRALAWAQKYPYCSLGDYVGTFQRPIIEKSFLQDLFSEQEYREFVKGIMEDRAAQEDIIEHTSGPFE